MMRMKLKNNQYLEIIGSFMCFIIYKFDDIEV